MIAATGEPGSADIRLPYSSGAASSTFVDPRGGSWVEVADEGGIGKWVGIVRELDYGETEIRITAEQPQTMLGDRIMHWETTLRHAQPVGYVAGKVLREALPGVPYLWMDPDWPYDGSDPLMRDYAFSGQDAWAVLLDLMELCTSELVINADTGEVSWMGALAGDLRQTALLIADGNLRNWSYRASGRERAGEVMVKRGSERYSVYSGGANIAYPGQVTITADSGYGLHGIAQAELNRRSGAVIAITGAVPSELFSLRERDFVRVVVPPGQFSGAEHPCRILGRSASDDSPLMPLVMQVIDEVAGVAVAPPMRSGGSASSGAKGRGSFAQRFRSTQRATWRSWLGDH